MKFSDFSDPITASKVIEDFKKRFQTKICLAPFRPCEGSIISAHTLSAAGMLRPISREGHVYAVENNLYASGDKERISIQLKGIRETSVFNGFCSKHDKELFSPIEDKPFICSYEQLFLHAYRAVAKESYLKRKQAESIPSLEDLKSMWGISGDVQMPFEILLFQAASLRGSEEIENLKARMDSLLVTKEYNRLRSTIFEFEDPSPITVNSVFSPDFDFDGEPLQDFADFERDLSQVIITFFSQGSSSYLILSYEDTANQGPAKLIHSLADRSNLTESTIWLIACQCENFAISPAWFESISENDRSTFINCFKASIDLNQIKENQLKECKPIGNYHSKIRRKFDL